MSELIEIADGLYVQPRKVVAIKRSELDEEHCTVFLGGQSALDGFAVERDAEELAEEINAALSREDEE